MVVKEFIYFYINKFPPEKLKYYLIRVEEALCVGPKSDRDEYMKWPALEGFFIIQKKEKKNRCSKGENLISSRLNVFSLSWCQHWGVE